MRTIYLAPETSCPNVGQQWDTKHSTRLKLAVLFNIFHIFDEYGFSLFQKDFYMKVIVRDQKSILLEPDNLAFKIPKYFE